MRTIFIRLALLLIFASAVGAALFFLPVREYLMQFVTWVRERGIWGPIFLGVVYILATVLFVPGSPLTLGAGFAFGVVPGVVAVSLGSTLGASAAFLIGRFLLRDFVEQRVARSPKFGALDQAVAEQGFKVVLLTRLSPVFPYNLLNYAYGLTKVHFRDYFLASWIGMFPATVVYVYLGSVASDLAELEQQPAERTPQQQLLFYAGLAATVIVTLFIARLAKRTLDKALTST